MTAPEAYHRARIASDKIHDHTYCAPISLPPTRSGTPRRAAEGPLFCRGKRRYRLCSGIGFALRLDADAAADPSGRHMLRAEPRVIVQQLFF